LDVQRELGTVTKKERAVTCLSPMARGSQATQPEDAGGGASPRFENSISEAPRITEIEFSEVDGENIMKPVFNRTPVTCLSIFDSILFQSFLDGSTIAFDLSTRQSFPLTGTRPMAFFPPLLPLECSSSDASSDASDAEDAPPTASRAPPPRPPEPAGKPPEPALPGGEDAVPPRHITSAVTEGAISPHSIPVRKLEDLSPETFARTPPDAFEPLLLTGATRGWAAHERWTFPFFAAGALGQTHVTVTGRDGKRSEMTLGAYIGLFRTDDGTRGRRAARACELPAACLAEGLHAGPCVCCAGLHSRARDEDRACGYLRGWTYEHDDESLKNDFALPHFAHDWFGKLPKRDDPCFRWIFLGPGGSKTPLHVDPCLTHAWLAQIRGRKRFVSAQVCECTCVQVHMCASAHVCKCTCLRVHMLCQRVADARLPCAHRHSLHPKT